MYADTKHLPVYTSMDGQLTLSTAYIENGNSQFQLERTKTPSNQELRKFLIK